MRGAHEAADQKGGQQGHNPRRKARARPMSQPNQVNNVAINLSGAPAEALYI